MMGIEPWVRVSAFGACAVAALVSCGGAADGGAADEADQSVDTASSESALTAEVSDEVSQPASATSEDLATAAAVRLPTRFSPAGCVVATKAGATVTYLLTDCTGPYGLAHVTGTITAVYSRAAAGAVQVVVTGTGLKVNQATLDLNSTVVATQAGGTKTTQVTSDTKGTGPRGAVLTRKGSYSTSFDGSAECLTLSGTWETAVGQRKSSTVVTAYKRCKGQCPAAGGSIVHTEAAAKSVAYTVQYDGTAAARWSTSGGRSGTFNLACTTK
jgi:hypothetical protein